jgi:hypothetical protein
MRVGLSRVLALGLGDARRLGGRRAPEPEAGERPEAHGPAMAKPAEPPLGAAEPEVPGTKLKRRRPPKAAQ